jgi:NlpC/P60 family putative phage cell wall peptidase
MTPDEILTPARAWLGTPYHHQASVKGVGCDCLGLVRGVYQELYGRLAEAPPPYSRDWAEASSTETMLEGARRHFTEIARTEARPGDVLVFRMRAGAMAKHVAILSAGCLSPEAPSPARMIHAIEGALACEVHLNGWWRRRIAAAFRFPDKETPHVQPLPQP